MHLETVLLVAAVQGYAEAVLLWISPWGRRVANRLFAALLFAVSTAIVLHVADEWPRFRHLGGLFRDLAALLILTFGPLLLFYARALAGAPVPLARLLSVHLLPALGGGLLLAVVPALAGPRAAAMSHGPLAVLVGLQAAAYLLWITRLLGIHSRRVKDLYSSLSGVDLRWLRVLVTVVAVFWVAAGAFELLDNLQARWHGPWSGVWSLLALTVFLIGYQGLRQPAVFAAAAAELTESSTKATKYEKSTLSPQEASGHARRLEALLAAEKPYLESGLTLGDLAGRLAIPPHDLSRVINERLGVNFYEAINRLRVEEARRLIADPGHAHLTLAAIAQRCGFNAISAFNAAFKRYTGQTPSRFRAGPTFPAR